MLAVVIFLLIALGIGDTLEFCEDGAEEQLVVFNNISQTVYITSPNFNNNHNNNYSITNNCSITIQLLVSAPIDVHITQDVTECSVPYKVDNVIDHCEDNNTTHMFYVTFWNDTTSNISIILPAGNGSSFSCVVSAHNLPVTTSTTNLVTSTSIPVSTTTELTELSSTEDSTTTPPDTSTATNPLNAVKTLQSTEEDSNALWKGKTNVLAVGIGAGAGGLLLVICIIVVSCVLFRRHSHSRRGDDSKRPADVETHNEYEVVADNNSTGGQVEPAGTYDEAAAETAGAYDETTAHRYSYIDLPERDNSVSANEHMSLNTTFVLSSTEGPTMQETHLYEKLQQANSGNE